MKKHESSPDHCCGHSHDQSRQASELKVELHPEIPAGDLIQTTFRVSGMDCADEVSAIQAALRLEGVASVHANLMAGTVIVRHLPSLGAGLLRKKVETAGVRVRNEGDGGDHELSRLRILFVTGSGFFALLGIGLAYFGAEKWISIGAFLASVLLGGALVFPKAFRSVRQFRLDINVLMSLAVVGAFAVGEYSEGAMVVFLFALSELLESFSVGKARKAIREVMDLAPSVAILLSGSGEQKEVSLNDVKVGDLVLVKSGAKVPMDGVVKKGNSLVNQAPLTGESMPVEKGPGSEVFAGTLNESGAFEMEVRKPFEETKASQIIRLIEEAQRDKAPAQRFVDTFARYYTPSVFLLALLVFLIPPLIGAGEWSVWLYRALVLLVIACPCALVLSTPVSIVSGLAALAKRGVLVKGGVYLEVLGKVRAVALDKTGTLTHGRPKVRAVHSLNGMGEKEIVEVAASLESQSSHPLARAIAAYGLEKNVENRRAADFRTVVGYGVEARLEGHPYFLGNHRFAHETGVCTPKLEALLEELEEEALSVVVVGHKPHANCKGEVLGVLTVGDEIRGNSARAVKAMLATGVRKVVMLSGDNQRTAQAIAKKAGIEEVRGDLLPEDKAREVKRLVSEFGTVAMVGDGINDAPALAAASLGIAMGTAGTDAAIETADVALMKDDLEEVGRAIAQGKRVLSVIRFNIGAALAVKAVFLVLALAGDMNLWLAVAADTGTSLLVVANALRLLRVTPQEAKSF